MSHPESYYHDLYDYHTIKKAKSINNKQEFESWKYERWKHRADTITNLIKADQQREQQLNDVFVREDVTCRYCGKYMISYFKTVIDDRVLVLYRCSHDHLPHRGIYEDGSEFYIDKEVAQKEIELAPIEPIKVTDKDRRKYCFTDEQAEASFPHLMEKALEDLVTLSNILDSAEVSEKKEISIFKIKKRIERMLKNHHYGKVAWKEKPNCEEITFEFKILDLTARGHKQTLIQVQAILIKAMRGTHWYVHGKLTHVDDEISGKIRSN